MMKTRLIILLAATLAFTLSAWAQAKPEEKDPVLKMSQVPQKVQQAIQQYAAAAEIKQITKGDVDGKAAYEFAIEKNGRKSEVAITPDGKVLTTEEQVTLQDIPEGARKAINAQAGGGKVVSTERVFENGKTAYGAVIEKNNKQSEYSFAADGKIASSEEDISLPDIPEAARKVISAKSAGGKVISTKKVFEDGQTVFAAIIEKGGKQTEISVAPNGKIVAIRQGCAQKPHADARFQCIM
jgi:uncharacterized protein YxeA